MATSGRTAALIIIGLILIFGIIDLGTGIGITARYRQYHEIFRPSVGLAAFNIVIGLLALVVAVVCLLGIIRERPSLIKIATICSGVLAIFAIASLIAALVINSKSVTYVRSRLSFRVNSYSETEDSIDVVNRVQTNYQCCGENSWLDWEHAGLGSVPTRPGINTGIGTGINPGIGTGVNTVADNDAVLTGRRRRRSALLSSPLVHAIRRRRQIIGGSVIPSTAFNLPLSCCKREGSSAGNAIGGFCAYSGNNSVTNFYVQGCIGSVANVLVLQITGIVIINLCLIILAVVLLPILISMFPTVSDPTNPNNKPPSTYQNQQEQQFPNGGYYATNPDPNAYYSYPQPGYITYQ